MTFTEKQIKVGKRLVSWLRSKGYSHEHARKEVAMLLKRHKLKDINKAMTQSNCTSLKNLKINLGKRKSSNYVKKNFGDVIKKLSDD